MCPATKETFPLTKMLAFLYLFLEGEAGALASLIPAVVAFDPYVRSYQYISMNLQITLLSLKLDLPVCS